MTIAVMWRRADPPGFDRCLVETTPEGHRIAGTTLVVIEDRPCELRYSVLADPGWRTRTVGVHASGLGGDRRLAMETDGEGGWSVAGSPLLDLYGAIDIDLAWTPATSTLPVLRLDLPVGETTEVTGALVDFPSHDVARSRRRYTRVAEHRYRVETGGDTAELTVDDRGLVVARAPWEAIARETDVQARASSTVPTSHRPENS